MASCIKKNNFFVETGHTYFSDATAHPSLSSYVACWWPKLPPFLQNFFWLEKINWWNDKQWLECNRHYLFTNWIKQYFVSGLQNYHFYYRRYRHYGHYGLTTCLHSVSLSMETVNTETGSKLECPGQGFLKPANSENQVNCKSWFYSIKSALWSNLMFVRQFGGETFVTKNKYIIVKSFPKLLAIKLLSYVFVS